MSCESLVVLCLLIAPGPLFHLPLNVVLLSIRENTSCLIQADNDNHKPEYPTSISANKKIDPPLLYHRRIDTVNTDPKSMAQFQSIVAPASPVKAHPP